MRPTVNEAAHALCAGALVCALVGCVPAVPTTAPVAARPASYTINTVVLPYRQFGNASKVGDSLFVAVDTGTGRTGSLIRYDLISKTTTTVVSSDEDIASVDANSDWLVWETKGKLIAQSLRSGKRQVVSSSRELYAPALEGDMVAWLDKTPGNNHNAVVCNLATGVKTTVAPVTKANLYNNFFQIHDGKLVWTDVIDDAGYYRIYDVETGKLDDYRLSGIPYRYPGYAIPSEDRVYSINFRNTVEWDWTDQQLGYYSRSEKRFVTIPTDGYINYFRLADGYVAIVDANQRLSLRPVDDLSDQDLSVSVLESPVDSLESSDRETLIAGWAPPDQKSVTLYVIEFP